MAPTTLSRHNGISAGAPHRPRRYTKPQPPQEPEAPQGDPLEPEGDPQDPADPLGDPQDPDGPPAEPEAPQEPEEIPEGMTKVTDLTDWAGTDPAKAQAVLDQEGSRAYQRPTLIEAMEAVVAQHDLI